MGKLTDQARELVEHFGSQHAAARAVGVPHPTLRYWLDPAYFKDRARDRYWRLSGVEYNRRLLQIRRQKALRRRVEREQRRP